MNWNEKRTIWITNTQEKSTNIYYRSYYKGNDDALLLKTLFDSFFLYAKFIQDVDEITW